MVPRLRARSANSCTVSPVLRRRLVAPVVIAACLASALVTADKARPQQSRYLFAWVGDEDRVDSDFLAVIDLTRHGDRHGTIVATTPVGEKGLWPHHTEHDLGASKMLFANGFAANRNLLFNLHDPRHPRVVERF